MSLEFPCKYFKIMSSLDEDDRKKFELAESLESEIIFICAAPARASCLVMTSIFPVERTKTKTKPGYSSGSFEYSISDGR